MPIYEYQALKTSDACRDCRRPFEALQAPGEKPLENCPSCGAPIRRIMSWCHSAVTETPRDHVQTVQKIRDYERSGMWSHAAELADKHAEKTKNAGLRTRALDNYRKAGYDPDSLAKYDKSSND